MVLCVLHNLSIVTISDCNNLGKNLFHHVTDSGMASVAGTDPFALPNSESTDASESKGGLATHLHVCEPSDNVDMVRGEHAPAYQTADPSLLTFLCSDLEVRFTVACVNICKPIQELTH